VQRAAVVLLDLARWHICMDRPACRVDPATARRRERIRVLDRALRLVRVIAPVKRRKPQRARGDLGRVLRNDL